MDTRRIISNVLMGLFVVMAAPMVGSADVGTLLQRDLLTEDNGRFVHDQTIRCRFPTRDGGQKTGYFKRHIEAPSDLISRDNFVYVSTRVLFTNRAFLASILDPTMTLTDAMSAVQCGPVDPPATGVDFTISISMHTDGIHVETTNTKSAATAVDNLSWADVLGMEDEN